MTFIEYDDKPPDAGPPLAAAPRQVITIGLTNRDMRFFRYTYPFRVNR